MTDESFRPTRRQFLEALAGGAVATALPAMGGGKGVLPEALEAYVDTMAKALRAKTASYPESFFFLTDLHNPSNFAHSGRMIAALTSLTGIRKTFCGGDLPGAFTPEGRTAREEVLWAWDTYRKGWIDPICAAGGVVYTARGNHDLTVRDSMQVSTGATLSGAETRELFCLSHRRPYAVSNEADPTACYFYRDVPAAKLRYIVADSSDQASDNPKQAWGVKYGVGETQLRWLADVAFGKLPAGWDAIVIQHIPPAPVVTEVSGEMPQLRDFRLLMEAFQNRGTFTLGSYSRDFARAKGRILLNLSGHEHADRWSHWNGIPYITVACDANYFDYIRCSPYCGRLPRKGANGTAAQTFDAVRVSADHETILLQRIGGGQDRLLHTRVRRIAAGKTLQLAAPSLSSPTWVAYDGDRVRQDNNATDPMKYCTFFQSHATVSAEGVVTAGTPGSSMVFAHDADYRKELYCVETVR